jgi:hypothetical protein
LDPSDKPTVFRAQIRDGGSRAPIYLVIVAAIVVVGVGFAAKHDEDAAATASGSLATDVAVTSPQASFRQTAAPTPLPTAVPTPLPTFAPFFAPGGSEELSPTGVLVASAADGTIGSVAIDRAGTLWIGGAAGLTRLDPRTGEARRWTLADDLAFASSYPVSARQGGIWLVGPDAIRRFDGARFAQVIDLPGEVGAPVVEDLHGTLWAPIGARGLVRWTHGVWTPEPPGRTSGGVSDLAIDGVGHLWTVNYVDSAGDGSWSFSGVSIWDGSTWTNYLPADLQQVLPPSGRFDFARLLTTSADGTWVVRNGTIARFDGGGWAAVDVPGLGADMSLSAVGDDGRLWFVPAGCDADSCGLKIQAWDGATLATFDEASGLPGADSASGYATMLAPSSMVIAASDAGLYQLAGTNWRRLSAPGASDASVLGSPDAIAAVSATEVWASFLKPVQGPASAPGELDRFDGTTWVRELATTSPIHDVVTAPDGVVWVTTDVGPEVRRSSWVDLAATVTAASPPATSSLDCSGALAVGSDGTAFYAAPHAGAPVVSLRETDGTWTARIVAPTPGAFTCARSLAVGPDGALWLLDDSNGALWRSTDGGWESVAAPPSLLPGAWLQAIAVATDGSLWTAFQPDSPSGAGPMITFLQLSDGAWVRHDDGDPPAYVSTIAFRPDGSVIAAGDGVSVFDGQRWHGAWNGVWINDVSVAPDGTVWGSGASVYRLPPSVP